MMFAWWNGKLCSVDEVRVSPFDRGFTVGDGVFETLVARGGRPVAARRHWERLVRSCDAMGIECMEPEVFWSALNEVLQRNGMSEARLRVTLTGGVGPVGSGKAPSPGEPSCLVTASELKAWPETESVVISPWPIHEKGALAGVKTTSYGGNVRSLAFAHSKGCGEAILLNSRDEVCEGTGSNLFLVVEDRLMTPPLSSGCLPGTARAMVLEACRDQGMPVVEAPVPASALTVCTEAFLTSSTRDVHPIREIESRQLASTPGTLTRQVIELYQRKLQEEPTW